MALENLVSRLAKGAQAGARMLDQAVESGTARLKTLGDSASEAVTSVTESISGTVIKDELITIGKGGPNEKEA